MAAPEPPLVDVIVDAAVWDGAALARLAERAARATLVHLGLAATGREIALLACDDARIAALNADYRDKPQPTNVLSWPAHALAPVAPGAAPAPPPPPGPPDDPDSLGDIALAHATCAAEAAAQGKPLDDHVAHLVVHAVLHLLGYDHQRDKDAALMEETEAAILASLGLADPYRDRADSPA